MAIDPYGSDGVPYQVFRKVRVISLYLPVGFIGIVLYYLGKC